MTVHFDAFSLDEGTRELRRRGDVVHLSPKAFELLVLLVERRPKAVSKDELHRTLWPASFVVAANLGNLVAEVRAALGDDARRPRFIRTVYGFGFAFCAAAADSKRSDRIHSLAILPLDATRCATSVDQASSLSDGLTEALIGSASALPGLTVISRRAVQRFSGIADSQAAGRELQVDAVLTGRIDDSAGRPVVSIELMSVADASVLLARKYESRAEDVLPLHAAIAADLVARLSASEAEDEQRKRRARETADGEASRHRQNGRFFAKRLDPQSQRDALRNYQLAIARDPTYAMAYSDAARACIVLAIYFESPGELIPIARTYIREALRLHPSLPEAHVNLGLIDLLFDWNAPAAARELVTSSGVAFEAIETFSCTTHLLEASGQLEDAEKEILRALAVDPLSSAITAELGCNSYYRRRYDDAIVHYRRALNLDPRNVLGYFGLGRTYAQQERFAEALSELRKVEVVLGFAPPLIVAEIGYIHGKAGDRDAALAMLDTLAAMRSGAFIDPFLSAVICAGLDARSAMFDRLQEALEIRSGFMLSLAADPKFDAMRSDRRFRRLMRDMAAACGPPC